MPTAALRPCASPGCPELVARGRCPKHQRAAQVVDQQRRGTAAERGYGARWQAARVVFLSKRENALCRPCSKKTPPWVTPATVVDHVVDHKGDRQLFWDESNWQPSCQPCHDARTDAGDFGRSA